MAARRQVRRAVTVAAPPGAVWRALVERDLVARWLGAAGPRRVVSATPGQRLVFWWWPEAGAAPAAGDVSVVEIDLEADPGGEGTRVTVTETALADRDDPGPGGRAAEATLLAGGKAGGKE